MFNLLSPFKLYASIGAVLIISSIVGVGWYKYNHALTRASVAEGALITYKALETAKSDAIALENAEKLKQANTSAINVQNERDAVRTQLNLANATTDSLRKDLLNGKTIINRALANQLRHSSTASDSARLPEVSSATALPAEVGDDCNATLARVTRAAQDTTINFNSLYDSWAKNCLIYGCDSVIK